MQMDTTRNAIHTTICTKGPGDSAQRARKSSPAVEIEIKVMQPPDSVERTVKNYVKVKPSRAGHRISWRTRETNPREEQTSP